MTGSRSIASRSGSSPRSARALAGGFAVASQPTLAALGAFPCEIAFDDHIPRAEGESRSDALAGAPERLVGVVGPVLPLGLQLVSFTVEADPFSERNLIYGVADMGLFASDDGGNRWWVPNGWVYAPFAACTIPQASNLSFDAHVPGLVVAGLADRSAAVSYDGGVHFAPIPGADKVPSGCSSKILVDRRRLFYLTTGSGVYTRTSHP